MRAALRVGALVLIVSAFLAGCGRPSFDPATETAKARRDSERGLEHHPTKPYFKDDHL